MRTTTRRSPRGWRAPASRSYGTPEGLARLLPGLGAALLLALAPPVAGQTGNGQVSAADSGESTAPARDARAMKVPFGPGEHMRYRVKLGVINVGEGAMRVEGVDTVRGHPSYKVSMSLDASMMGGLAQVHDRFESWLDTRMLVSRRFVRDIHELNYKSRRVFEIYPEEKRWERADADQDGNTPSVLPLDEISMVYFVRSLPLEVGETYTLNRYFKEDGNPVVIRVLRRETIEVPAGTFETVVVQPIIKTDGLFGEGGEAELYFTDDDKRQMVYMRSKIPLVGSITLHLESAEEGSPLNPG